MTKKSLRKISFAAITIMFINLLLPLITFSETTNDGSDSGSSIRMVSSQNFSNLIGNSFLQRNTPILEFTPTQSQSNGFIFSLPFGINSVSKIDFAQLTPSDLVLRDETDGSYLTDFTIFATYDYDSETDQDKLNPYRIVLKMGSNLIADHLYSLWMSSSSSNTEIHLAESGIYSTSIMVGTYMSYVHSNVVYSDIDEEDSQYFDHFTVPAVSTIPSGIGINVADNLITGTNAQQEYSTNNGVTWSPAADGGTLHSFAASEVVMVRLKATSTIMPSGTTPPFSIAGAAPAPQGISLDIAGNQIMGTTVLQEYTTDNGNSWLPAKVGSTSYIFSGLEKVMVRFKATSIAVASEATIPITVPTRAPAPLGITVDVGFNQIKGTTLLQEYTRNAGTTWTTASSGNTPLTFVEGDRVRVRVKATANALASSATPIVSVAAPANAPTGIDVNVALGIITGTRLDQVYSVDDGLSWYPASN